MGNRDKVNPLTGKLADKSKYYIDPEQLKLEIVKCQELSSCTDTMAGYIMTITQHVYNLPKYSKISPQDKEEMTSFNIYRWLRRGLYSIDVNNNPFSYITHGTEFNGWRYLKDKQRREEKEKKLKEQKIEEYAIEHGGQLPPFLDQYSEKLKEDINSESDNGDTEYEN